jgi:porin
MSLIFAAPRLNCEADEGPQPERWRSNRRYWLSAITPELRRRLIAATMFLSSACLGTASYAQTINNGVGIGPSEAVAEPPTAPPVLQPAPIEHMLPDWGGIRSELDQLGINIVVDYWGEAAGNVSGGLRQGADYAGQLGLELDLDLNKILGVPGLSFHTDMVQRHGRNHAADYLGDHNFSDTQIFGAGGNVAVHMVYFYLEQKLLDGRIDMIAGRYTLGADFGASPLNCIFMALTVCGNPRLMPLQRGFSSWPLTDWGGRIRVRPTDTTYVMTGVFESSVHQGGTSGFEWSLGDATGAVVPIEVGYEPSFGKDALTGHYKLGAFFDTSDFPDYYYDDNGDPASISGLPYKVHSGRGTVYVLFDQMLMRNGPGLNNGVNLLAGYLHSDSATSPYRDQAYVGLVDQGINPARPRDSLGVMYTYFQQSKNLANQEILQNVLAGTPFDSPYVSKHQMVIELTYDFHFHGFDISPDFQYIIRPDGSSRIPDAAVFGLNSHFVF